MSSAQIRANDLQATIDSMVGRHKDDFIRLWGAPSACTSLSSGEICEWHKDLGQRGGAYAVPIRNFYTGQVTSVISGDSSHQAYEDIKVEFSSKQRAVNGSCTVQH